jgi:hypothetical protein
MPTDHLIVPSPDGLAAGVLAVLAGADLEASATRGALDPRDLDEAVEIFRDAGLAALERRREPACYQVCVQFPDWSAAEAVAATVLGPRLDRLQASGALEGWWFLRKHPCWRLRPPGADRDAVDRVLDELIGDWQRTMHLLDRAEIHHLASRPAADLAFELRPVRAAGGPPTSTEPNWAQGRRARLLGAALGLQADAATLHAELAPPTDPSGDAGAAAHLEL